MGKNRGQIKADVQSNLADLNITFFTDSDLNTAVQDAYTDIAITSQCIQKSVTLNWLSNANYYNLNSLGVTDYLGVIGIFNNVTNLWLRDDISRRDFDRIRRNWETWVGAPQFWAPSDPQRIIVCPKYYVVAPTNFAFSAAFSSAFFISSTTGALGSFVLWYYALAPTLSADSDTFLIASDMEQLVTQYATADLLEQAQEFGTAGNYWNDYYSSLDSYKERVHNNTKSDLLLRV